MRRSSLAPRVVVFAFVSGTIALAGCPAGSDQAATVPVPQTVEVETETVEIDEEEPSADPGEPSATSSSPAATESVGTEGSSVASSPAVTIERPKDFLRPTLPDAALRDEKEEPADPPVEITDRSAEAEDPTSLPGGTPIDDLFEGLEDKPSSAPDE